MMVLQINCIADKFRIYGNGYQKSNESAKFVAMLSENSDLAVGLVLYIRSYHLFQIDIKMVTFCIDATKSDQL